MADFTHFSAVQLDQHKAVKSGPRNLVAAVVVVLFLSVFAVAQTPSISSLSPTSGAVGASVTVNGANFGSTQGTSTVTFNSTAGTPSSWSNTQIVVPVPSGATTGNVVVTVGGSASNGVNFTVGPVINSLSPTSGEPATSVTIPGNNFTNNNAGSVTFNGVAATSVSSWTNTSITALVPNGATSGNVVVTTAAGLPSNGVAFTVLVPTISSLTPSSGEPLASFTIAGSNFGSTLGTVTLNGQTCGINSWSDSSISANVPYAPSNGNVVVTNHGLQSNGVAFTVLQPAITSLSPSGGAPGALITVSGSYFQAGPGSNGKVTFSGQTASISSWSDSSIAVYVPAGASTGNVVVNTYGGLSSNGVAFTVVPIINSLTPSSAEPGASVTIAGKNFTSTTGTVTLNGQAVTVSSWSNTSVTFTVPNGATSGNVVVTAGTLSSSGIWLGILRPAIASVTPTAGNAGASVTISGNHFGSTAGSVSFNGQTASISSWSDTSIVASVPSSATTGNVTVTTAGTLQSNGVKFIVGPYVSSLTPGSGNSGTSVTITGVNFGSVIGGVTFNGLGTSISSWTNSSIVATVPTGATTGAVVVTVPGGATASGSVFVVPTVNSAWDQADVGTVGGAGSTSVNSGAYTVSAYSGSLGGTADSLHYLFEPASGDFDMIVRVNRQTQSSTSMQ